MGVTWGLPPRALGAAVHVAARPSLWGGALRQVRTLAPTAWWRRPPFLPIPDRDWLAFRLTTAYGDGAAPIDVEDLEVWLRWSDTVGPFLAAPVGEADRIAARVGNRQG